MYVSDSVLVIMMCILHNVYHNWIPLCIYLIHSTPYDQHLMNNDTLTLVVTVDQEQIYNIMRFTIQLRVYPHECVKYKLSCTISL